MCCSFEFENAAIADEGRRAHLVRLEAVDEWRRSMSNSEWQKAEAKILAGMNSSEIAQYRMSQYEQVRVLSAHAPARSAAMSAASAV